MPAKSRRLSWTPLWGFLPTPIVQRYEDDDERLSDSSHAKSSQSEYLDSKWSQAIISNALALLALAPSTDHKRVLEVTLGEDDKAKEFEFDMVLTELSDMGITVRKSTGDKQHTVWKAGSWTETADKPAWRYRYPRKPDDETIAPNPNISKDNGPLHKTRRSIQRKFERTMTTGKADIVWWKRGPGRNKSWKAHRQMDMDQLRLDVEKDPKDQTEVPTAVAWNFSTYTVPLSYLRGHGKKPVQGRRKISHRREAITPYDFTLRSHINENVEVARVPQWQRVARDSWRNHFTRYAMFQPPPHSARAEDMAPRTRIKPATRIKPTPRIRLIPHKEAVARSKPTRPEKTGEGTGDFLRLIVGVGGKMTIVSENYLSGNVTVATSPARKQGNSATQPTEMVLSVATFLRYDSHADVYAVKNPSDASKLYEGHLFFCHGLIQGNWFKYGTRKMDRMRKSKLFVGECVTKGRPFIVVTVTQDEASRPKKTDTEFPSLPKVGTEPKASKALRKKNKETYAAVAHRGNPSHGVVKLKHPSNRHAYRAWQNRDRIRRGLQPWETYHRKNRCNRGQNMTSRYFNKGDRIIGGPLDPRRSYNGTRGMGMAPFNRGLPLRAMARYPRVMFTYGRGRGRRSHRVPEPEGWGHTQEMHSSSAFSSANRFAMLYA